MQAISTVIFLIDACRLIAFGKPVRLQPTVFISTIPLNYVRGMLQCGPEHVRVREKTIHRPDSRLGSLGQGRTIDVRIHRLKTEDSAPFQPSF